MQVLLYGPAGGGGGGGGYSGSGFQVTGMIEGCFGFEIFDSENLLGRISWVDFLGALIQVGIFGGYSNSLKIRGNARVFRPRIPPA